MYFLILQFLVVFFLSFWWLNIKHKKRNELISNIPCPRALPIINHSPYFIGKKPEEILQILEKFSNEYGPVWKTVLINTVYINIEDPKILEEILSSQKWIEKAMDYNFLIPWLGEGLLISKGQKWHQRRKILTPAFHFKILEQFVEVMEKHAEVFVEKLRESENSSIDVFPLISLFALDVICETAMGYDLDAQRDSESEYVLAVKEIAKVLAKRFYNVLLRNEFLYRFTGAYKREKAAIKVMHAFTKKIINERRNYLKRNNFNIKDENEFGSKKKKKLAFLDLLLQIQKDDPDKINDEGIREEVDTFMFEGHDTITSALSFALLNLAKYPEMQQKVYQEVIEKDKPSTIHVLNQMTFLDKFIKESLRLYPSVPIAGRAVTEDIKVGGFTFPKGAYLNIPAYFLGRNPKIFPAPLKFDPSRFESDDRNPFAFIPFSAGPRNCIGQKFAMLEMKSFLSKIVQNFHISVLKEHEDPIKVAQLTLRPRDGIILSFRKRE